MKRFPFSFSKPHRFSYAHVLLAHVLVILTGLAPTPLVADMLSSNLGHASGGTGGTAASSAPGAANSVDTAAATAQAQAHAQDMLSRNTLALDAVNAMQEAARAAAAGVNNLGTNPNFPGQTLPDVPNGLVTGGLDINGVPIGANTPTQSVQNAHTIVTIQQTQQQALLNWNTFNVGKDTTVKFDQSAGGADVGTWIAFNKITDPSGNPTQILGSIEAQGQVYIINQNGIIFGGSSEVNTHAMVVSALPINDNLVTRGLLNNPDSQFLFSALAQSQGNNGPTPAFTPPSVPAFGKIGNVTVQAGAQITAPTSASHVGGMVALIGPNVTNNGTISTPDGQTILAAGMQVGFSAHNSSDPSLRGLDVYVGSVGSYGGTVTNGGLLEVPRGSIIMAGSNVNQNGFIDSSTSVAFNGRIDLLANYNAVPNANYSSTDPSFGLPFVYQSNISTGIVRTGAGSVMQILPEWASKDTLVGTELALKSQINLQGLGIYLGTDSVILAPNANVAISAGIWDLLMANGSTNQQFVSSTGQIYMDQGATVDVSGSTAVSTSLSDYIVTITLRAAELADAALQRNGSLRGQTLTVDLRQTGVRSDGTAWVGTPLANLNGYLGLIQRTVGQLTLAGGTVTMTAGNSVVMQAGSEVNVSSGYQDFSGGNVATSRLISGGNLVDIAAADPNVAYSGIYTGATTMLNANWGTSSTTIGIFASNNHYEASYSAGGNGGTLQIISPTMALDGHLEGSTIIGQQQLTAAPLLSTLSLQFQAQQDIRTPQFFPSIFPTSPDISFQNGPSGQVAVGSFALDANGTPLFFPTQRVSSVILSPDLLGGAQGFGSLSLINSNGNITIPANVTLATDPAGSITLSAANINVEGQLLAPGGSLNLTAYNISPSTTAFLIAQGDSTQVVVPTANGVITIGSTAVLSTAGLVVDNRTTAAAPLTLPTQVAKSITAGVTTYASTTQGGSIHVQGYSVDIAAGSLLNVSGGLVADRSFTFGNGGSLSIQSGNDPLFTSLMGGRLNLAGSLQGFSGASGGSLTLQAPVIQIGGTATYAGTLLLQPEFFSSGGFSQFTLSGLGLDLTPPGGSTEISAPGVIIAPGTLLQPVVSTLTANSVSVGTVSSISLGTTVLPEGYRSPVKLSFTAQGITGTLDGKLKIRGNITIGEGSQITTDALGSVSVNAQTIEILGSISAPAGTVSIVGAAHYPDNSNPVVAFATVHLGAASVISTAGKTVYQVDPFNRRTGTVYAGGNILVSGNIVADAGAVLNVSGTSAVLDLTPQQAGMSLADLNAISQALNASYSVPRQIDSSGGTITLKGAQFLTTNATLLGSAGGSTAQGGSLVVSSGHFILPNGAIDDKDFSLQVAQDTSFFAQPVFGSGAVLGQSLVSSSGAAITAQGYFGANSFLNGGFDSLTLSGNVQFNGAVSISANGSLHIADGGVLGADALVSLTAPYVSLGRPLMVPTRDAELVNPYQVNRPGVGIFSSNFGPSFGTGKLVVTADLIEVGFLSLQNIGQASLTARQDLRGNGYFDIAGDLTLTAGQVYPTTASTFTITAYNYISGGSTQNGSVTILSSGVTPQFPLSGGGRLNIFASTITQSGTLRAPLGTITLGWDGTGTAPTGLVSNVAVPATQQITLKNSSITSVSAIDPLTGAGVQIPYGIILNGTSWIDPTGLDITSSGAPDKSILISSVNLSTEAGSAIDIRGGGNLFGYQWVSGNGGTVDILASTGSFAIIPGFSSLATPSSPYSTTSINSANLGKDLGYTNATLKVGDKIYLNASSLNAAGSYTLLPARYALLPGALLITPSSGTPTDSLVKPGGAVLTSGYLFNGLNPAVSSSLFQQFEVAPQSVINVRAQYNPYLATNFIPAQQQSLNLPATRTPYDAGYALLSAQQTMQISGGIQASGFATGRDGRVDINSPLDIILALSADVDALNALNQSSPVKKLILDASLLDGWNAGSLLVGGRRSFGTTSSTIKVSTNNLTLNAGAALKGTEIILAANQTLLLAAGSSITQSGTQSAADSLVVNGNGALVRVSGVATAQTSRTGVTSSALPKLQVAAGATLSGPSITLDSSNITALDSSTVLNGQTINLNSGRISLLLTNPGALQSSDSLVLSGTTLAGLQTTSTLSLTSYTSIDLYGDTSGSTGGKLAFTGNLALHAGEIRGVNTSGGTVNLSAQSLLLDNSAMGAVATPGGMSGNLNLTASIITIGQNTLTVNQFSNVTLNASNGIQMQGSGTFSTQGNLTAVTPFFTASSNASQNLVAAGILTLSAPSNSSALPTALGLGAQLTLTGSSIVENTALYLPSGLITLHALTGDITVGGVLNASGTAQTFFDTVRYTDAGAVQLSADQGNIILLAGSSVNLSASGSGNAGSLVVSAPYGSFTVPTSDTLHGMATGTGINGTATLDINSIVAAPSLSAYSTLNTALSNGGFSNAQNIRLRSGSVSIDGTVNASSYMLSVDQGSITVNGTINASGKTGGTIQLIANGNLTLNGGSLLTVAGQTFNSAGKGGSIWLESGAAINGVVGTGYVSILANSTLDFTVASKVAGNVTTVGTSAFLGQFSGTLHIRAPQTASPDFIQVNAIQGTLKDPSNIVIEGYKLYTTAQANAIIQVSTGTTTATGAITDATWKAATLKADASAFFGTGNANYTLMFNRLVSGNAGIMALENQLTGGVVMISPGIELENTLGSITLGSNSLSDASSSAYLNDWDLASYRFGPKGSAGVLTIRAANNLVFYNALSDGFQVPTTGNGAERMWLAPLMALSTLKPVNNQSWSFRLAAGADFSSANFRAVLPSTVLPVAANATVAPVPAGSLLLGKDAFNAIGGNSGGDTTALTRLAINPTNNTTTSGYSYFQVIRTGTGDIDIAVGGDLRLVNQFASIYTAGAQVSSGTTVFTANDFVTPIVAQSSATSPSQGVLGSVQQLYAAQFSMAGGNVSINALNDILHTTTDGAGNLLMDSERELPNNWLMRRDYVNSSGNYGAITVSQINDTSASTAWWINFSNFFDGVAALGGGNVTLKAGRDVQNVDAHTPTNARAAKGAATSTNLLELGGGDLVIQAGRNIDGGVYYVERGTGLLQAGGSITTNATRSPGTGTLSGGIPTPDEAMTDAIYQATWLPTTLFVGKSSFNVNARGDVLLGPVANTMLLPQGLTNRHWYKTYFSTYNDSSSVTAASLGGDVTFRLTATTPQNLAPQPILSLWMRNQLMLDTGSGYYLPWLRLLETDSGQFTTLSTIFPSNLRATAYSGDINLVGDLTLAPSATGSLELLAAGSFNGLQPTGISSIIIAGQQTTVWTSSTVNLSDADPKAIPSFTSPLSYYGTLLSDPTLSTASLFNLALRATNSTFLNNLNALFQESGSMTGENASTQSKQALHAKGLLHANDTKPVLLYAKGGSLSGLTLFSAKSAVILAQQDITDIAFFIQNVRSTDVSIVSSGRDIVAYNANSALRALALSPGNFTANNELPNVGDIQISGPGSLQVLTGRNLDLGTGSNNSDGTGVGITSIGNGRNPYLPFAGADILLAAGMGKPALGLAGTNADFTTFITQFATSPAGNRYLAELATSLGVPSIDLNDPSLTQAQQRELALALYYLVLRDAGRDHNDPDSPDAGTYTAAYAAIAALFPTTSPGSIETQARDVRTKSGGNISILAPDGGLQLASLIQGDALAPPGIITEAGGNISIFADNSINIGVSRIFTLRGGDIMIWSSKGDIAAGSSSKTVQSAPPTRVLIDPQSANVSTDLAGLATGGGIGVLATVAGVRPGNVDLIAPIGAVDAGDAGIRATGNLNIAATIVLNAANISVGGTSAGTPAAASVAAPSLGGLASAASSAGAATTATTNQAPAQNQQQQSLSQDQPSIITVEVLGYGGGAGNDERKRGISNDQPGE